MMMAAKSANVKRPTKVADVMAGTMGPEGDLLGRRTRG